MLVARGPRCQQVPREGVPHVACPGQQQRAVTWLIGSDRHITATAVERFFPLKVDVDSREFGQSTKRCRCQGGRYAEHDVALGKIFQDQGRPLVAGEDSQALGLRIVYRYLGAAPSVTPALLDAAPCERPAQRVGAGLQDEPRCHGGQGWQDAELNPGDLLKIRPQTPLVCEQSGSRGPNTVRPSHITRL